jgi:hypothetical protein
MKMDPCLPTPYPKIFMLANQDCVINRWCPQVGKRYHHHPTWIDLVSWVVLSCGVVAIIMIQTKDGFYRDQFPMNIFLPLAIEVFRCLHQQEDGFLHQCANMAWGAKGIRGLPLSISCNAISWCHLPSELLDILFLSFHIFNITKIIWYDVKWINDKERRKVLDQNM